MFYEEWDEIFKNNKLKEFKNFGVKSKLPDEIKSNRTIYYAYKREYNKIWTIYDRNMSYLERGYKKYHKSYYDKNLKFESEPFWQRVNTSVEAYHKYGMYLVKKEVSKYLDEEVEEVPEPEFIVKKVNIEVSELQENMKKKRKDQTVLLLMMVFISTGILMYFGIHLWQEKYKNVEQISKK